MIDDERREERRRRDRIVSRHSPRLDEYEPIHHRWDHAVEFWDVIRPAWWPILVSAILCFLVLGVGQIRDLLAAMPISQGGLEGDEAAGVSGRFWTTFAACAIYAFMAWAFGRGLLSIRYPYTPCPFDPPAWHVIVRMVVARGLGLALPVSCAVSYYSLDMAQEAFAYAMLALVLFLIYLIGRRYMHDWIDIRQDLEATFSPEAAAASETGDGSTPSRHRSTQLGDIDEALEEAEETLEEAARAKDVETRQTLLRQVSALADAAGSAAGNAVRVAGEEFGEADLFDRIMPDRFTPQIRFLLYGILVFHAVAAVLFFLFPVTLPQSVGAVAILFLAIAGWMSFGVFAFCYFTRYSRLPPAILLFAVWLAFASLFNDNHELARLPESQSAKIDAPYVDDFLDDWLAARQGALPQTEDDAAFPIFLIAAEGGGARAAYWTGAVLSELNAAQPASGLAPQDHILMISGVSGGALGAASYGAGLAEANGDPEMLSRNVKAFLSYDFLSPVMAGGLYHDFFTDFVPLPLYRLDRAKWLEQAWIDGWEKVSEQNTFGEDYRALWDPAKGRKPLGDIGAVPLLVYNTTSVRTGGTWTVSPVRFSDERGCDSRDFQDLLDASGKGMSLATAAHLSARFTGISPAGRIDLKGYDNCAPGSFDRFVDGAYYENSGADISANVVRRLKDRVERFCFQTAGEAPLCNPDLMPIVPVAIVAEIAPPSNPPTISHETTSVLMTVSNTRGARGTDSINQFEAASGAPIQKVELALSWFRDEEESGCQVSARAEPDSDNQAEIDHGAKRRVPLGWALSQSAVDHMCRERISDPVLERLVGMLEQG